jgi:hypothetical protein
MLRLGFVAGLLLTGCSGFEPEPVREPAYPPELAAIHACYDAGTATDDPAKCDARADAYYAKIDNEIDRINSAINKRVTCMKRLVTDDAAQILILAASERCKTKEKVL